MKAHLLSLLELLLVINIRYGCFTEKAEYETDLRNAVEIKRYVFLLLPNTTVVINIEQMKQ